MTQWFSPMGYQLSQLLLLALHILAVSLQAPNDVSQFCKDNSFVPDYPETVKPLMDSWSYNYLLGENGVWMSLNLDDYPEKWVSYGNGSSSPCAKTVSLEEPASLPQNNWLITQHISKSIYQDVDLYPILVYVNLSYTIDSSCSICHDTFQLLLYYTNSSLTNITNKTSDFFLIANLTDSPVVVSKSFIINPGQDGFYLALRDSGTNLTVTRFLVYRLIGPAMQLGLTLYPETPAPSKNSTIVNGVCVANANTTSGGLPLLSLDQCGLWIPTENQCNCIEGHHLVILEGLNQCQACVPGTYKFFKNNSECLNCPKNSISIVHGASMCPCFEHFYRSGSETYDSMCTQPPSAPLNLQTKNVTNTSVVLVWGTPTSLGGREDTYFDIFISALNQVNNEPVYGNSYIATGLSPNTFYQVTVVAQNGVSKLAGDDYLRKAIAFMQTSKGVPPKVKGVYVRKIDGIVEWLPTDSVNGMITKYQVQLFSSDTYGRTIDVDKSTVLYQVNVSKDFPVSGQPVSVRVRAFTSSGSGSWSDSVVFADVNFLVFVTSNAGTYSFASVSPSHSYSNIISSTTDTFTRTGNKPTSSSAMPTQKTSESENPVVAIVAVVAGAIFILILVAVGGVVYYVFRKIRLRHESNKEDTDYVPLSVHFNPSAIDEDDEITVKVKDDHY